MCKFFVLAQVFVLSLFLSQSAIAQCSDSYGKSATYYDYSGRLGSYGIASGATFCQDGVKYAQAEALEIVKMSPGPNAIRIHETHYDQYGNVMYEGYAEIQFGFGGSVVKEEAIRGKKKYAFFTSWPSGR